MQSILIALAATYGITSGRAQSLIAVAAALVGVVAGVMALARTSRATALIALAAGSIGVLLGTVRLANSTAIGTGSGRLGAILAMVVASIGIGLGALALNRLRRVS